jgi:hypothetical protein
MSENSVKVDRTRFSANGRASSASPHSATDAAGSLPNPQGRLHTMIQEESKGHPCTGTVALYRPYGP